MDGLEVDGRTLAQQQPTLSINNDLASFGRLTDGIAFDFS